MLALLSALRGRRLEAFVYEFGVEIVGRFGRIVGVASGDSVAIQLWRRPARCSEAFLRRGACGRFTSRRAHAVVEVVDGGRTMSLGEFDVLLLILHRLGHQIDIRSTSGC